MCYKDPIMFYDYINYKLALIIRNFSFTDKLKASLNFLLLKGKNSKKEVALFKLRNKKIDEKDIEELKYFISEKAIKRYKERLFIEKNNPTWFIIVSYYKKECFEEISKKICSN